MKEPIVVVGLGQMGGAFAHGFLRCGHPVHPVPRGGSMEELARALPKPALVLVAVGEAELRPVLEAVPSAWRDRLALLQNELLPSDWRELGLPLPTIAVVWFEKKKSTPIHVVLPTVLAGPRADLIAEALAAIEVPFERVDDDALLFQLVKKNLYILTANIAGLEVGGTVGALWSKHRDLAGDVAAEIIALQAWRAGETLPQKDLVAAMGAAFEADPEHLCTGRSAPFRLARALSHARQAGLRLPTLERIAAATAR